MRALSVAVRERIRVGLDVTPLGSAATAFAEAVVLQRAHPLGEAPGESVVASSATAAEQRIADQVTQLIARGANGDADVERAAGELADDPALLAACFQNLDLLPADGSATVDGIALMIAGALQRLADLPPG